MRYQALLLAALLAAASPNPAGADILDFLWSGKMSSLEERQASENDAAKTCSCTGPSCLCCVDFNLTYIDLGGPGCVQVRYISQEEGIAVNVSYGNSTLHSDQVKPPNPNATCMAILSKVAHICARFTELQPQGDALRGCLNLEPTLLGEVTTSFNIGCFVMGKDGAKMEETNSTVAELPSEQETDTDVLDEENLLAIVNESAQQGLTFFSNLLGLAIGRPPTNQSTKTQNETKNVETTSSTVTQNP